MWVGGNVVERRRHRRDRGWRVSGEFVAFLAAAVGFGVVGAVQIVDLYWLRERGEVVMGTVLEKSSGKSPSIEVRYVTGAGETIVEGTTNYEEAEVGQSIAVIYDPLEPRRMQAEDYGLSYWFPAVFLGVPTVGFLIGAVVNLRD
nr:DUF3592 domain-containing protein [Kribbella sandramycini]